MKSEKLRLWMRHPEKIGTADLRELEELVGRYPYFQSARILYLKALFLQGGARFRNELKSSTIHLVDHRQLFRYLNNQLVFTEPSGAIRSELAELVDERIREIDGHIVVTTQGIPAFPESLEEVVNEQVYEEIGLNLTADMTPTPVPQRLATNTRKAVDDQKVISNPVMIEGIPGVIDNYSEDPYPSSAPPKKIFCPAPIAEPEIQSNPIPDLSGIPGMLEDTTPPSVKPSDKSTLFTMSLDMDMAQEVKKIVVPTLVPNSQEIGERKAIDAESLQNKANPVPEQRKERRSRKRKDELIEQFIQSDPVMPKISEATEIRDLSKENPYGEEELFSETLAKIYLKQQLYEKAIATYIKLSLKYPEKSIYFADRIEKINEHIK